MPREAMLARAFVELADTLVADFDVVDLLTVLTDRCIDVLDVEAAGLMLVAPGGELRVMASSNETMHVLELFEIQAQEGPCLDSYRTGEPVLNRDLATTINRWPSFSTEALAAGYRSVHALPMRLRGLTIGALNLFNTEPGVLETPDVDAAQALADVATIAVLQHRAALEAQLVNEQLSGALNSRIVIEQAKGRVAEREDLNMDEAFNRLRSHARNHNLRLADVARQVIDGELTASALDHPAQLVLEHAQQALQLADGAQKHARGVAKVVRRGAIALALGAIASAAFVALRQRSRASR